VLDRPLVPRVLYGNSEAPRFVLAARFWPFLPLWFAANPDLLPRDVPGTAIIDFASGYAEGTFVLLEPMPRIRFNDATPTIGRGAAEAALFRESVERMDRP
jgi:hypothetical protein